MTHNIPHIAEVGQLRGRTVLLRSSLNVPVVDGIVTNDFRLQKALETITFLREQGARIVLIGHIGREKYETLYPVYEALRLHIPSLRWADGLLGADVEELVSGLRIGEVVLLENVRSHSGEVENDPTFATDLADLADIYVNDAFADSHREHASIVGLPTRMSSYAGLQFMREYETLSQLFNPKHPAVAILGGAKAQTKLPLVEAFQKIYDTVFVGGALAHDFFTARGYEIGKSLSSDVTIPVSVQEAKNILTPLDVVVRGSEEKIEKDATEVGAKETIYDAGSQSLATLQQVVKKARTVVWNGPLGNFEEGYREGTEVLAQCIAEASAYSVVGGGDTIAAIQELDIMDRFDFVSTAGGAMISFLTHHTLSGIDALVDHAT